MFILIFSNNATAKNDIDLLANRRDQLPDVPKPVPPYACLYNRELTNYEKIDRIQNYIDKLQYNHTGLQFFNIRKDRPLIGLTELARKMIDDSLPIKCLEAVILSIYLTNEMLTGSANTNSVTGIEKFSIGFKTVSNGNVHRHVVLGIYCHNTGLFGALGISRRTDLGHKQLRFRTLTDLILSYIESYNTYLHKVKRIKIGNPIPCSNRSYESIPWNGCTVNLNQDACEWPKLVEKHSRKIRHFSPNFLGSKQFSSVSLRNLANVTNTGSSNNLVNNGRQQENSYLDIYMEKNRRKPENKFTRSKSLDQNRVRSTASTKEKENESFIESTESDTNDSIQTESKSSSNSANKVRLGDLRLPTTSSSLSLISNLNNSARDDAQKQSTLPSLHSSVKLTKRKKSLRV